MVYTAKSYYTDYYFTDKDPDVYETKETTFKLVKQDGKWLIDSFILPD
ncbi:MAG: hypothetical protein ACOX45_08035 [Acutalibacteraceae bacterium]